MESMHITYFTVKGHSTHVRVTANCLVCMCVSANFWCPCAVLAGSDKSKRAADGDGSHPDAHVFLGPFQLRGPQGGNRGQGKTKSCNWWLSKSIEVSLLIPESKTWCEWGTGKLKCLAKINCLCIVQHVPVVHHLGKGNKNNPSG